MTEGLTDRQQEILDYIVECMQEESYTPTVREIAERFGMKSTNAVRQHLAALERKGAIERRAGEARAIMVSEDFLPETGIPVIGRVAAGAPVTAVENVEGHLSLETMHPDTDRLYALRVQGSSMVDDGIYDGDYAVVREQPTVRDNAIGVAVIDEEATVKRIRIRDGAVHLIPANDAYEPIVVDPATTPFRIGGQVVGIHRVIN